LLFFVSLETRNFLIFNVCFSTILVDSIKSDWLLKSAITRVCAIYVRVREYSGVAIQIDFWTDVDFRRKYIQDKNRELIGGFKGGGAASPLVKKIIPGDWHFLESCNIYASCPEGKNFCKYFSWLGLGLFANILKKICLYYKNVLHLHRVIQNIRMMSMFIRRPPKDCFRLDASTWCDSFGNIYEYCILANGYFRYSFEDYCFKLKNILHYGI